MPAAPSPARTRSSTTAAPPPPDPARCTAAAWSFPDTQLVLELPQSPVHASLDGGQLLAGDAGDLGNGEVRAVAQRDRLALLVAQRRQRPLQRVSLLDCLEVVFWLDAALAHVDSLERPRSRCCSPRVIAQQVERDRVEPGLLGRLAAFERPPRPQHPLERVGQQVLGERRVAAAVNEKREQPCRVLVVEPLKVLISHQSEVKASAIVLPSCSRWLRSSPLNSWIVLWISGSRGSSAAALRSAGAGSRPAEACITARS